MNSLPYFKNTYAFIILFALSALIHFLFGSFSFFFSFQGDSGIYIFLCESFFQNPSLLPWFETPAFYPYGKTLAFSDNFYLPSLLYSFFRLVNLSPEISFAALSILARTLGGYCLFLLARKVSLSAFSSMFLGVASLLTSYFLAHLGHPQLQFFFWLPLGLSFLLFQFPNVSVHGVKNITNHDELERQLLHPFLPKPNRLCRFCERFVVVTPDLLRKSTPEGLFAKQFRVDKSLNPPERLPPNKLAHNLFWFSCCVFGAFLTTVYYAVFLGLCGLFFITSLIARENSWSSRFAIFKTSVLACLPAALLLIPFTLPYFEVAKAFGKRHLYEAQAFAGSGLSLLSFSPSSVFYHFTHILTHGEAQFGFGILLTFCLFAFLIHQANSFALRLAFACLCIALLGSSARELVISGTLSSELFKRVVLHSSFRFCVALAALLALFLYLSPLLSKKQYNHWHLISFISALGFCLALGPLGNPTKNQIPFGPYALFAAILPGLDAIRASARFLILPLLMSILTLGYWLDQAFHKSFRSGILCAALFSILFLFEQAVRLAPATPLPQLSAPLRSSIDALPQESVLLFYPYAPSISPDKRIASWSAFAQSNTEAMYLAATLGKKTVNGYSGVQTKIMRELPRELAGFPDARSLRAIRSFAGLSHVLYRGQTQEDVQAMKDALLENSSLSIPAEDELNMLIKIKEQVALHKKFILHAPPQAHTLQLTLKNISEEPASFEIFDSEQDDLPLYSGSLKNAMNTLHILIPPASSPVKPRRLSFHSDALDAVLLVNSKIAWQNKKIPTY